MLLSAAMMVGVAGCATAGAQRGFPTRTISAEDVYARAQVTFDRAIMYKPAEPSSGLVEPVDSPLIVQEVIDAGASAAPLSGIGIVYAGPDGAWHVDAASPAVYVARGSDFIGGEIRPQTVFAWCHEAALSSKTSTVVCRGLRVTYDAEGFPIVWEVLDPSLRADIVFVSNALEQAAEARYGEVLEGRRHRVERAMTDDTGAIVPRVLDDGPMPMGPYVYLDAERGEVATVLCRCMASQVEQFVATTTYQVLPFAELDGLGEALLAGKAPLSARLRWPDGLR